MGEMVTFGRNAEGQLGRGHTRPTRGIDQIKGMQVKLIN